MVGGNHGSSPGSPLDDHGTVLLLHDCSQRDLDDTGSESQYCFGVYRPGFYVPWLLLWHWSLYLYPTGDEIRVVLLVSSARGRYFVCIYRVPHWNSCPAFERIIFCHLHAGFWDHCHHNPG